MQGQTSKAIQFDCSRAFINMKLETWCKEHGIEIHLTVPYSPSQNGLAEQMNHTLAELGHTMLIANDLPEFLWEYSIMHATYLQNHTYTEHLPNSTPYQEWHNQKPNVSHLWEFGTPVCILLQEQKKQQKMQPKSKHQIYVSYDEGTRAVMYYNVDTHKILTSCNFHHLTLPDHSPLPDPVMLAPNVLCEGESEGSTLLPHSPVRRQVGWMFSSSLPVPSSSLLPLGHHWWPIIPVPAVGLPGSCLPSPPLSQSSLSLLYLPSGPLSLGFSCTSPLFAIHVRSCFLLLLCCR
jgi:hypothetical protein